MKKILPLLISIILLSSCASRQADVSGQAKESTQEATQAAAESTYDTEFHFWFSDSNKYAHTAENSLVEEMYNTAVEIYSDVLANGTENAKVKLFFDKNGRCSVISDGGFPKQTEVFLARHTLTCSYVEICLDSRFNDGVGVSMTYAANEHDIPEKMPDSFNFADGTFDGDLSEIRTYPELTEGVSLAEYEFNNMSACIEQLNIYAAAGAQAAWQIFSETSGFFDNRYTELYGTAHTILCSDENGSWSVQSAEILTEECAQLIANRFSADNTLSGAKNCTVQLMFYMESFVGVSANYSADEKFFATYDVEFWQPYKAPYEGSYHDKSFLYWYGIDGCLKAQNGRLCPVGTYCIETGEPLGVYVAPSVMGDWRPITVGTASFEQYAEEISDGWTDYSQIVFRISESQLFVYNIGSISLYDLVKTDDGYDVEYHGMKHGSITVDENGTVTLYLRHRFTNKDMNLPMVLERVQPPETNTLSPVKPEILSAEEYVALDTQEYGLLDLSGERVMGQEIPDPNVLSQWRDYVANGGAYTMETYCVGAMRLSYELYSADSVNGYYRWDLIKHDEPNEPQHGWETIYFDNIIYSCGYELDRYDLRKYEQYEEGDKMYCSLFNTNEWAPLHFVKAYTITIGGVEYVAEEWQMGDLNNGYIVYSIDGEIKAYEGQFYDDPVTYTVTKLVKQADDSLIARPERLSGTVYNNDEE